MGIERRALDRRVDENAQVLKDLAQRIHAHPELRFTEQKAAAWITDLVERAGAQVERGLGGLATSFRARTPARAAPAGPRIAILAEYDALPDIGHACGHNLIAAGAVGAFLALHAEGAESMGTIELVGTPAEEGGGGKITLLEAGVFEGIDAVMMFHPFDRDLLAHHTLASTYLHMEFIGRPSHAALAPWDGTSALTACLETFRLIDSQRVHLRDGARIHGIVTNGGQAVNIIPERAASEFSVRAPDRDELGRVRAVVERCARGAALACGVELRIRERRGYDAIETNMPLARAFGEHLRALGRAPRERDPSAGAGSTDMGDLSHAVPAIHPWLQICDEGSTTCHQHAFAAAAASARGFETMLVAAKAMARTAADLLENADLRRAVREAFEARPAKRADGRRADGSHADR